MDIQNELNLKLKNIDLVGVANVGQGNLNFLLSNGMTVCYFDLGGGTGINKFTYTSTILTCKSQTPLVILSHWDMDHVETAIRDVSNCNLTWLAPIQKVGKTHYTLALRISASGKLMLSSKGFTTGGIDIIKCSGSTKNDSGFAMVTPSKHGEVLLPGDATYNCIPGITNYSCLVASHHGSKSSVMGSPLAPSAINNCWIVFSYGNGNTWHHPHPFSILEHTRLGWHTKLDTIAGNIIFDGVNYLTRCGISCSLSSSQHF